MVATIMLRLTRIKAKKRIQRTPGATPPGEFRKRSTLKKNIGSPIA